MNEVPRKRKLFLDARRGNAVRTDGCPSTRAEDMPRRNFKLPSARAEEVVQTCAQELLRALPPRAGALAAARMALPLLVTMNATQAAAQYYCSGERMCRGAGGSQKKCWPAAECRAPLLPAVGLATAFLDFADFNATFRGVFRHLRAADTGACVALASAHDLAEHSKEGKKHARDPRDNEKRRDLADFLARDPWYRAVVGPYEEALRPDVPEQLRAAAPPERPSTNFVSLRGRGSDLLASYPSV